MRAIELVRALSTREAVHRLSLGVRGGALRPYFDVCPNVLAEPWAMRARMLMLNSNPDAGLLPERGNCAVPEVGNVTSQIHH